MGIVKGNPTRLPLHISSAFWDREPQKLSEYKRPTDVDTHADSVGLVLDRERSFA
jgi:hypothetical protein